MSTTIGMTMIDDPNIPGGIGGLFAGAGAAIVGAILWLRRFLSKDGVERAADSAYKTLIDGQAAQIAEERKRNQSLRASLDEAITQISALRQQVSDLSNQVAKLQREITGHTL